jgi:hypothetical protein
LGSCIKQKKVEEEYLILIGMIGFKPAALSALLECRAFDKRSYLPIRVIQINVGGFMGNPSFDLNSLLM